MLCAQLFRGTGPILLAQGRSAAAPATWPYFLRRANYIFGLEILALVAFFEGHAPFFFQGASCWIYLRSNNCLAAIVRGDSITELVAILVARFWLLVQGFNISVWFPHARPKLNPAELPTRGESLPPRANVRTALKSLKNLYSLCRTQLQLGAASTPPPSPLGRKNVYTKKRIHSSKQEVEVSWWGQLFSSQLYYRIAPVRGYKKGSLERARTWNWVVTLPQPPGAKIISCPTPLWIKRKGFHLFYTFVI